MAQSPIGKKYTQEDHELMDIFHAQLLEAEKARLRDIQPLIFSDNTEEETSRFIKNAMMHVLARIPSKSLPNIERVCPLTYTVVRWGPFLIFRRVFREGSFEDEMTYIRRVPVITKRNLNEFKNYPWMREYVLYAGLHTAVNVTPGDKTVHQSEAQEVAAA